MENLINKNEVIGKILDIAFAKKDCTAYDLIEEINKLNEPILKNKIIELPCFVDDIVFYIQYPTLAASWCTEKPIIVPMKVVEVSYIAKENGFERIRIDTVYKNKLGDDSHDWFIWSDGFLYTSLEEAEKALYKQNLS